MSRSVHLVGSIGLDTVDDVFDTVGRSLGPYLKRIPDGEPGGRRAWISWQYSVLRSNPFLQPSTQTTDKTASSQRSLMRIADGVAPEEIRFGELGYAREARASYEDFRRARESGAIPKHVRFQVCLPPPYAVVAINCPVSDAPAIEAAYEKAMLREIDTLCKEIPHGELSIQWDYCIEMLQFDGWTGLPAPTDMVRSFGDRVARISAIPPDVELGFHLCYGDLDGKHYIEPRDASKMVELANLILAHASRPVNYIHMPVPISRADDEFFAPLKNLKLNSGTELYLGLVHAADGIEGTGKRMETARKYVSAFGIASECGLARGRTPDIVSAMLHVHEQAAQQ